MVGHIVPVIALGEPHLALGEAGEGVQGVADRGGEDVVSEHELLPPGVGVLLFGIVIVERAAHADTRIVCLAGSVIDIGGESVAQFHRRLQVVVMGGELPDAALEQFARAAVGLENGGEDSVLHPAGVDFGIGALPFDSVVAADVVSPVSVAHVGGGEGEVHQVAQHLPGGIGVAAESELVAVASEAAPSVVDEGPGSVVAEGFRAADLIVEEGVIDPEGVVEFGHVAALAPLLPVEPPEVHSLGLQGVNHRIEVGVGPLLLVHAVGDGGVISRLSDGILEPRELVSALFVDIALGAVVIGGAREVVLYEIVVAVLHNPDSGGGVEVEGGLVVHRVEVGQQAFGILYQVVVPGIAGPASALAEFVPSEAFVQPLEGVVPVHVDDEDVGGDVPLADFTGYFENLVVGVREVAAPPVAEGVFRRHGDLAGHLDVIADGCQIVVAVGEDVEV